MTDPGPAISASQPALDDLTTRVFRALDAQSGLHRVGGTYVVTPKGTPLLAAPSLGEIARQISRQSRPLPGPPPGDRPGYASPAIRTSEEP